MAERQRSLPWPQFRPPSGLAYLGYIHSLDRNHKTVSAITRDLYFSRAMCSSFFLAFDLPVPNQFYYALFLPPLTASASTSLLCSCVTTPFTHCTSRIPPYIPILTYLLVLHTLRQPGAISNISSSKSCFYSERPTRALNQPLFHPHQLQLQQQIRYLLSGGP